MNALGSAGAPCFPEAKGAQSLGRVSKGKEVSLTL